MKTLFMGVLLALTAVVSVAKPVLHTQVGSGRVVLFDEKRHCPDGQMFFQLEMTDRVVKGCWAPVLIQGQPAVVVKDEEGDGGYLLMSDFEPVEMI